MELPYCVDSESGEPVDDARLTPADDPGWHHLIDQATRWRPTCSPRAGTVANESR